MNESVLESLGWRPFFAAQLSDAGTLRPARVVAVHRGRVEVIGVGFEAAVALTGNSAGLGITVGDWVLLDPDDPALRERLHRFSLFRRRAAGTSGELQLIAANVDTLFIVTSADRDFNVARLERYLAIAHDAGVFPVVVITKADTVDSIDDFRREAAKLSTGLLVESMDARDPEQVAVLKPWCETGQTVALLGSSGVGKSTLVNSLSGAGQATREVRGKDQRGRHTTTRRSMHRLRHGGWLIDTPGMRELQLVDVADALEDVFSDIVELATRCRFTDCGHAGEPGCAVQSALDSGRLDGDRLRRYHKLQAEERRNSASLAERRARDRSTGKFYKSVLAAKKHQRDGDRD